MVGRGGVEPPTSRLSGVRSNHLSYRPIRTCPADHEGRGRRKPAQADPAEAGYPLMKGHEDGGMFFGMEEALPAGEPEGAFRRYP